MSEWLLANSIKFIWQFFHIVPGKFPKIDPGGCAVLDMGLQLLACWECGLEFRQRHGCLRLARVVWCAGTDLFYCPNFRPWESYELWCAFECDQAQQANSTPTVTVYKVRLKKSPRINHLNHNQLLPHFFQSVTHTISSHSTLIFWDNTVLM